MDSKCTRNELVSFSHRASKRRWFAWNVCCPTTPWRRVPCKAIRLWPYGSSHDCPRVVSRGKLYFHHWNKLWTQNLSFIMMKNKKRSLWFYIRLQRNNSSCIIGMDNPVLQVTFSSTEEAGSSKTHYLLILCTKNSKILRMITSSWIHLSQISWTTFRWHIFTWHRENVTDLDWWIQVLLYVQ